mmetsp:Transcript_1248/g.3455  ORF Transcript_1248/g.3455 Transcript_1248/m.3455 type:complete len:280 (+) Transcript_1248:608-1447(+)
MQTSRPAAAMALAMRAAPPARHVSSMVCACFRWWPVALLPRSRVLQLHPSKPRRVILAGVRRPARLKSSQKLVPPALWKWKKKMGVFGRPAVAAAARRTTLSMAPRWRLVGRPPLAWGYFHGRGPRLDAPGLPRAARPPRRPQVQVVRAPRGRHHVPANLRGRPNRPRVARRRARGVRGLRRVRREPERRLPRGHGALRGDEDREHHPLRRAVAGAPGDLPAQHGGLRPAGLLPLAARAPEPHELRAGRRRRVPPAAGRPEGRAARRGRGAERALPPLL